MQRKLSTLGSKTTKFHCVWYAFQIFVQRCCRDMNILLWEGQIGQVQVLGHPWKIQFHGVCSHLFFLISSLLTKFNLERGTAIDTGAGNMLNSMY